MPLGQPLNPNDIQRCINLHPCIYSRILVFYVLVRIYVIFFYTAYLINFLFLFAMGSVIIINHLLPNYFEVTIISVY